MADVKTGADADISPGTFWGKDCFLGSNKGFHDRVAQDAQCTTLCCKYNCFVVESERNGLTRAGQKFWKGPVGSFGT